VKLRDQKLNIMLLKSRVPKCHPMLAPSPSKGTEVFVSGTLILVTELHSSGLTDAKAVTVILIKTSEKENIHLETEAAALDNGVA